VANAEANAFGGQTLVGGAGGSSLAAKVTAGALQNPSAVQYAASNDSRGREKKAENAQNTGKQGNAAALATGAALTAAGVPMLASPIISVEVAGAELLAKAALEFAQAGADKKNAGTNGAQKDLLLSQTGQSTQQDSALPAKSLLTPQLDSLLTKRGVNAEDFVKRLQSGELSSPSDILKAMNGGEVNDQALQEGAQLANNELSHIFGKPERLGDEPSSKIDYDSSAKTPAKTLGVLNPANDPYANPPASGVSFSPGVGAIGAAIAEAAASPAEVSSASAPKSAVAIVPLSSEAQASTLANAAANSLVALQGSGLTLDPGELAVLAQFGPDAAAGALNNPAVAQVFLEQVGIQKLNPKLNIFQTAHRGFRNFYKWRKETRIASRKL